MSILAIRRILVCSGVLASAMATNSFVLARSPELESGAHEGTAPDDRTPLGLIGATAFAGTPGYVIAEDGSKVLSRRAAPPARTAHTSIVRFHGLELLNDSECWRPFAYGPRTYRTTVEGFEAHRAGADTVGVYADPGVRVEDMPLALPPLEAPRP